MSDASVEVRVRRILSEMLQVPGSEITGDFGKGDARRWDSLGHLEIVAELEHEFDVELTMVEMAEADTCGRLCEAVRRHLGEDAAEGTA